MAKAEPAATAVGMAVVKIAATAEEFHAIDNEVAFEMEANKSLSWLTAWRDALAPHYGPGSDEPATAADLGKQDIFYLADKVLQDGFSDRPFPEIVRTCFRLGQRFAQVELQEMFNPMVSDARAVGAGRLRGTKNAANKLRRWTSEVDTIAKRAFDSLPRHIQENEHQAALKVKTELLKSGHGFGITKIKEKLFSS